MYTVVAVVPVDAKYTKEILELGLSSIGGISKTHSYTLPAFVVLLVAFALKSVKTLCFFGV